MPVPSYAWLYQDPFHSALFAVTTTVSVLSNSLLLYILCTTSSAGIGSYKYLLMLFASCDMVISMGHAALQPRIHMLSTGIFVFLRHGPVMVGGHSCYFALLLTFIASYYQTFLILAYHYVYRLTTLSSGIVRSFTANWSKWRWSGVGLAVNVVYLSIFVTTIATAYPPTAQMRALAPIEVEPLYGFNMNDLNRQFVFAALWQPDPVSGQEVMDVPSILALLVEAVLFGATGSVIVYCIWRIVGIIRSPGNHLTSQTRKMQGDLFRALLIQSAVPLLFSYLPLGTILLIPIVTNLYLGAFGNVLFSITAIFPSIDAFFVLFFIGRFRAAVVRLFRRTSGAIISSSGQWTTAHGERQR